MIQNISKSEQLKNLLLDDIRAGIYLPGDALPSVRDLASRYEVSKHTVTQALSNLNELKVIEIAHGKVTRLRENPFRNRIEIIYFGQGVVESQTFWSEFYRGISQEAAAHPDYHINQASFRSSVSNLFLEHLDPARTCGILILGNSSIQAFNEFNKFGVPVLTLYNYNRNLKMPTITSELTPALDQAAELFRRRGRKRVAVFSFCESWQEDQGIDQYKFDYIRSRFLELGVMPDESYARIARKKMQGGYEMLHALAAEGKTPDGIFLCSDAMALGTYRAAHELGLKIPEDLAILGCDNLEGSDYMVPSLSSIELNRAEQGKSALRSLIARQEKKTPLPSKKIPAELVLRESFC